MPTNKRTVISLTSLPLYTPLTPLAMFIYNIIKICEQNTMQYLLITYLQSTILQRNKFEKFIIKICKPTRMQYLLFYK